MVTKNNKKEGWMRIPVGIISGIIIYVWFYLIWIFCIINFIYRIFSGKTLNDLAKMSEVWNTQKYFFVRYMTFGSENRPFPFGKLEKDLNKVAY